MLTRDEIKEFVERDEFTSRKMLAATGKDYYSGNHDIRNYKLYYYNRNGILVEDRTRSNIRISHPFFAEIVDQAVQYIMSGENNFFMSDIPELQKELDRYFNYNDSFHAELYKLITECMVKGSSYFFVRKGNDDRSYFKCVDMQNVTEVRAEDASDSKQHLIYRWTDRIDYGQTKVTRYRVWDSDLIYDYIQHEDGEIFVNPYEKNNPKPHCLYTEEETGNLYGWSYGCIPFFRLDNNDDRKSDLCAIKEIIDDYDIMNAGLSNNLQDASEYLIVIKGFDGENLDEMVHNIKTKKAIGINAEGDGGIEFKTVTIPYEARKLKMDEDEKNIYRFGQAFNSAEVGDGNITNVVIKSRYALLDMKCNKIIIRLRELFRNILEVVLDEINENARKNFQQTDVYFNFTREIITNAQDNEQIKLIREQTKGQALNNILNVASELDKDTVLQNICQILELDYEMVSKKVEENAPLDVKAAIKAIAT